MTVPGPTTPARRPELVLSGALAVASAAAAVGTLLPGSLEGTAVMNGSARGTALVVLLLAVPTLVASMVLAARGSLRARATWLGAVAYLAYNAVLFAFATPFNRLFLVYVAMLSLAFWSLLLLVTGTRADGVVGPRVPARAIAAFIWVVVVLNTLAWLRVIVPGLAGDLPPEFLDGTGLTTNPVFVQDLAAWLPATALVGYAAWQRTGRGLFLASAALAYWFLEGIGVAVDQWWGHRADPDSTVVSLAAVPMFAAVAAVTLVFLLLSLRWHQER